MSFHQLIKKSSDSTIKAAAPKAATSATSASISTPVTTQNVSTTSVSPASAASAHSDQVTVTQATRETVTTLSFTNPDVSVNQKGNITIKTNEGPYTIPANTMTPTAIQHLCSAIPGAVCRFAKVHAALKDMELTISPPSERQQPTFTIKTKPDIIEIKEE